MIQFGWFTAEGGYKIKDGKLVAKAPRKARVSTPSDDQAEDICLEFALLDGSPNSICGFASKYGLLKTRFLEAEPLSLWRKEIKAMREVLKTKVEGTFIEAADLFMKNTGRQEGTIVVFGPDAAGTDLELGLMPPDLIAWLWLQLGQNLKGRSVKTCKECGKFFLAGGGKGGRARQRRKTRRYCNEDCKATFNNRRTKKRKKLEKKET